MSRDEEQRLCDIRDAIAAIEVHMQQVEQPGQAAVVHAIVEQDLPGLEAAVARLIGPDA